ncbi:MAG TPA: UDPGP type 1 family protein [Tepidisphaeraceae bacterium]|nr:UDPGP type 1 family protein [Tepidisphaeraceae bacterium]
MKKPMDIAGLKRKLPEIGQGHVLRFYDSLDSIGRQNLSRQLQALDFQNIAELVKSHVRSKPPIGLPQQIEPVRAFPRAPDADRKQLYQDAQRRGGEVLAQGKVAAFLVAGGQGTRLGYDGPKGEYPITPVKNKPLFQVFAEQLLAHSRRAGRLIPWYVMTSDNNDVQTRAFFHKHHFFGYEEDAVFFFQQGMMPAFALDGRLLLSERDSLALSPDGHGGSLRALEKSGAVADMRSRGVEHLSYFQVDNPLVHCIDPLFLGLHDITESEMSSKTVPKAHAMERVGNFVMGDGALQVIEYSDLPESLATQTNPDGSLRFNAGSIAIHALRVSFIERLNEGGRLRLPWHRAEKKVPFLDDRGQLVKPDRPNAVKLEQFVFDAIPLAKNALAYTTDRCEEFSPVKNAEGPDSPETCRRDQIRRAARWLRDAGVDVPYRGSEPDAKIEISPLKALSAEDLRAKPPQARQIKSGASVYIGE